MNIFSLAAAHFSNKSRADIDVSRAFALLKKCFPQMTDYYADEATQELIDFLCKTRSSEFYTENGGFIKSHRPGSDRISTDSVAAGLNRLSKLVDTKNIARYDSIILNRLDDAMGINDSLSYDEPMKDVTCLDGEWSYDYRSVGIKGIALDLARKKVEKNMRDNVNRPVINDMPYVAFTYGRHDMLTFFYEEEVYFDLEYVTKSLLKIEDRSNYLAQSYVSYVRYITSTQNKYGGYHYRYLIDLPSTISILYGTCADIIVFEKEFRDTVKNMVDNVTQETPCKWCESLRQEYEERFRKLEEKYEKMIKQ